MRRSRSASAYACAWALALALACACVGTTGGQLVDFPAAAAGAEGATSPMSFDEATTDGHTWHVTLTAASLHVGAMYLNQSAPVSGSQGTLCVLPGTYVAQVVTALDVDLLSATPQPFPSPGHGTTTAALVGQVWLTAGDVNDIDTTTAILTVAGTATDDVGASVPFTGAVTIGKNHEPNGASGSDPICKQRIVSPIAAALSVATTGTLLLRIDARRLFTNVDFAQLPAMGFSDDPSSPDYSQPSINLYENLRSSGTYAFSWSP